MGKILVVDDVPRILKSFSDILCAYSLEQSTDGIEALEKVSQGGIDLIFSDCMMPRMNGWDFIETLKTDESYMQHADIPVVGIGVGFKYNPLKRAKFLENEWVVAFDFKPVSRISLLTYAEKYCQK